MNATKLITILLIGMMGHQIANAQDTLFFLNGNQINVRIKKETTSEISYLKWRDADSSIYMAEKSLLKKICYMNGDVNILNYTSSEIKSLKTALSFTGMYEKGQEDAIKYYKNHNGAGTGTLIATILGTPLIGLGVAAGCLANNPIEVKSNLLMSDSDYYRGYVQQTKAIKTKIIWKNFAIGVGIDAAILGILAIGFSNGISQ